MTIEKVEDMQGLQHMTLCFLQPLKGERKKATSTKFKDIDC